jgi:hypothetical protein
MRSLIAPEPDDEIKTSPDVVVCQGNVTQRMLEDGQRANGTEAMVLGSFRRSQSDNIRSPDPSKKTVLILPVGWLKDSKLLFDASAKLARTLTDHQFILRCHPVLPFGEIQPYLEWGLEELSNIEVSANSDIETDVRRSSVVIYRGTSAVFPAVLGGLKPIYAGWGPGYNEDPLFEVEEWCERPGTLEEAAALIEAYAFTTGNAAEKSWRVAADYVQEYFSPVTEESVDALIESLELDSCTTK